jgi:glycosyltransferase involved in cell wall biosynthesis
VVIISNGFSKFHLAIAAAEVSRRGELRRLVTGAYPTPRMKTVVSRFGLGGHPKFQRLLAREEEVPPALVRPLWAPELLNQAAAVLEPRSGLAKRYGAKLARTSLRFYGRAAAKEIKRHGRPGDVYHYRAGWGGVSVPLAKERGMLALCDHSIPHPAVLEYLVNNEGRLPPACAPRPISPFWAHVAADLNQADRVLVNSEYVKRTFIHEGWDPTNIDVIYLGVDDQFLEQIPPRAPRHGPVQLLFAGAFERRKGAVDLLTALGAIDGEDWRLDVVGAVAADVRARYPHFFCDPRVSFCGTVARSEVARRMSDAEIFLLPSLAEGFARVVFEALACGCYVITTPNAFDPEILEDGVNGAIVPPGDATALEGAIRRAIEQRGSLAEIGSRNAELVRGKYQQSQYGESLVRLYEALRKPERARELRGEAA